VKFFSELSYWKLENKQTSKNPTAILLYVFVQYLRYRWLGDQ